VTLLEAAYHEGKITDCAGMLLHLGLHLVQFVYRLPISLDPHEVMQKLLDRDRRSAIGIWYLEILNEVWLIGGTDNRSLADVLLGIHIVSGILQPHPDLPVAARRPPLEETKCTVCINERIEKHIGMLT